MKIGRLFFGIIISAFAVFLFPSPAYATSAQSPAPEWNIKIEYRYTEGEENKVNVPGNIERLGRGYHLIDRQAPVLEANLPVQRTYTWHIEGVMTDKEIKDLEDRDGVKLTAVSVPVGKLVDKTEKLRDLPTNDVDALPYTKVFQVASATTPGGLTQENLACAAVRFKVQEYDEWNLPKYYEAEIVYRGLETVMEDGYYKVDQVYTNSEDMDEVAQYVVVATYAPDQPPAAAGQAAAGGAGGTGGAGAGEGENGAAADGGGAIIPPIDEAAISTIGEEETPLTNTVSPTVNRGLSSMLPLLIGLALACCIAAILLYEYKKRKERKARRRARMTYSRNMS